MREPVEIIVSRVGAFVRGYGILAAALLIFVTNTAALVGMASNRRGEPDARLLLTERELPVGWADEENSGIALRLRWEIWSLGGEPGQADQGYGRMADWLDREKLEAIGFDCSKPLEDDDAELWYDKQLPRRAYAVLEYQGDAWREWLAVQEWEIAELRRQVAKGEEPKRALKNREEQFEKQRHGRSRLFLIDAGPDPVALRERYPDRSRAIITPAVVDLSYFRPWDGRTDTLGDPTIRGRIFEVLIESIHVARRHRAVIDAIREEERRAAADSDEEGFESAITYHRSGIQRPRYAVELHYGRRHEPWIEAISPLPTPDS